MCKILGIWFTQDLKEGEVIKYNSSFDEVKKNCSKFGLKGILPRLEELLS